MKQLKDKIRQIKYLRLKPEERFLIEMVDGIESFISKKYPQSIFWKKNDIILFEQDFKNGWLRCNYELIWSVLQNKYGYKYTDTQSFIKKWVDRNTKLGGLTPFHSNTTSCKLVDRNTKLGGLTPCLPDGNFISIVDRTTKLGGLIPTLSEI